MNFNRRLNDFIDMNFVVQNWVFGLNLSGSDDMLSGWKWKSAI